MAAAGPDALLPGKGLVYMSISFEEARTYLTELDLNYLAELMCADYYTLPRWQRVSAVKIIEIYKNFLYLQKKSWPFALVPTREIDEVWHNHILYTKKYFHDCLQVFGHYLHHDPAAPNENQRALVSAFVKTKELYFEEFNELLDTKNYKL
jgi:hypothetical protein